MTEPSFGEMLVAKVGAWFDRIIAAQQDEEDTKARESEVQSTDHSRLIAKELVRHHVNLESPIGPSIEDLMSRRSANDSVELTLLSRELEPAWSNYRFLLISKASDYFDQLCKEDPNFKKEYFKKIRWSQLWNSVFQKYMGSSYHREFELLRRIQTWMIVESATTLPAAARSAQRVKTALPGTMASLGSSLINKPVSPFSAADLNKIHERFRAFLMETEQTEKQKIELLHKHYAEAKVELRKLLDFQSEWNQTIRTKPDTTEVTIGHSDDEAISAMQPVLMKVLQNIQGLLLLPESRLPGRTEGILEKLRAAFVKLIEPADEEIHRIQTSPKYEREMKTRIKELALEHWKARVAVFTTKVKVHNMPKFEHIKEKIELIQIPETLPEDTVALWSAMIKKLKSVHARTLVDTWTREVSSIVTIDRAMHVHGRISQAISPLSPAIPGTDAMRGFEELHKLHNRWKEEVSNEEFKDDDILLKPLDRERFKLDPLLKERDKIDQLLAADINRKKSSMNESIIEACFSNSKWQSVDLQYAFSDHKTPASYLMELRKEVLSIAEKTNNEWKRLCNTRHAIPGYPDQTASVIDKLSSSPQWTPGYALLANQTIDIDPAKNGMLPLMKMLGFMIYVHYQSMLHQEIATM